MAWDSLEISADRRTITVRSSYPVEGFCVREPGGLDVEVKGTVAMVAVWLTGPSPRDGAMCNMGCGDIEQTITLIEPLPKAVERLVPVAGAVAGCRSLSVN